MKRKLNDFKSAAKKLKIRAWPMRKCSLCDYQLGYLFDHSGSVKYDAGCDCTRYRDVRRSSWQDVAEHYNMQDDKDVIVEMDKFWGF